MVDRLYRLAIVVIAAVLVIMLLLFLAGFPVHMKIEKDKGGGGHKGPKVTKSAKP